ncbi:hypothetical protein [Bdellovibrio sp. BCCA]|uniref:hypothetical protein n=1 Tax=Bdellovibrio sp. BCCA TaxID=3136281 RepID=UPI0030F10944
MNWAAILIPIISGVIGGNVAGSSFKKFSLGATGNSFVGLLGGAAGAIVLGMLGGDGADSIPLTSQAGTLNMSALIAAIASGGIGGGVLMSVVGVLKQKVLKKRKTGSS